MSGCHHFDGIIDGCWFLIGRNLVVEPNGQRGGITKQFPFFSNVGPHFPRFLLSHFCHVCSPLDMLNRRHTSFYPLLISIAYRFRRISFQRLRHGSSLNVLFCFRVGIRLFLSVDVFFSSRRDALSLDYTNARRIIIKTGYLQSITIWSYL